jgi:hypothetical protein
MKFSLSLASSLSCAFVYGYVLVMVDGDGALALEGFLHCFFGGLSSFYCLLMLEGVIYFIVLSFLQVKGSICLSQVGSIRAYTPTCVSTILLLREYCFVMVY